MITWVMSTMIKRLFALAGILVLLCRSTFFAGDEMGKSFTNSIGMKFVRIEPGSFDMGESSTPLPDELTKNLSYPTREELKGRFPAGDSDKFALNLGHVRNGDFDEQPLHRVTISQPFYMAEYEVTNAQYEKYNPVHRSLRGKNGFSREDDEAVVFVSWHEAKAFCDWLSQKEGLPYRLPTEAEWEYACRAGTTTPFHTGKTLPEVFHKNSRRTSFDEPEDVVPLIVGETPPNPWGLFDMHGNVEEWCYDWYGPYEKSEQTDPVGRAGGSFKVTRGGSHGTNLYYLRSANRMGTLPENKHWLIGLRVVLGELPEVKELPPPPLQRYQLDVKQEIPLDLARGPDPDKPYFKGPREYVKIAEDCNGPLFSHHNHDAAIVDCPNGDLLAIWHTCVEERGRELAIAASRLRYGDEEWEPASLFWDIPDRNDHCPALWFDGKDTIYHFNGLSVAGRWEPLAIIMRTSKDNGVTWSRASLIVPEHGFRQMVGEAVFNTSDGAIVFGADAGSGSTIYVSRDTGKTWTDPGGTINGIHAGIAQLRDGRLIAFGRGMNINGWMPMSISADMGKTWKASPSIFPPITGGQRAALIRLKEGVLFFAAFAPDVNNFEPVPDGIRPPRHISGIFGAVSYDDGKTWPVRRLISDCEPDHVVNTIDGGPVRMGKNSSEPLGYLSACQSADGLIHLLSSRNHYAFNLAWLEAASPEAPALPMSRSLPARGELAQVYGAAQLPSKANPPWHFLNQDRNEAQAVSVPTPGLLKIGAKGEMGARWSNERIDGFGKVDPHRGFTAEIAVQIDSDSQQSRGIDLEIFARGAALTVNHYLISITTTDVYYWYDNKFRKITTGLDNSSARHTYRLAVRDDTAVQIYRDENLLGVWPMDLIIDWRQPARGSFIEWGQSHGGAIALVHHVAYDLSGAFQP